MATEDTMVHSESTFINSSRAFRDIMEEDIMEEDTTVREDIMEEDITVREEDGATITEKNKLIQSNLLIRTLPQFQSLRFFL